MLVHHIQELVNNLTAANDQLNSTDCALVAKLRDWLASSFSQKILDDIDQKAPLTSQLLSQDQILWLEHLFFTRWSEIVDTPMDYTFESNPINDHWINLCKELASYTEKNYLSILIPVRHEELHQTGSVSLSLTNNPTSYYLSSDYCLQNLGNLLDKVSKLNGELSVINGNKSKLRALNLTELHRIRSKKGSDLSFVMKDELYCDFWDYFQRQLIPGWKRDGMYTFYLFNPLLNLIETFFEKNINSFQSQLNMFEFHLAACPAGDVNQLYGLNIALPDNQSAYVIDILLDCYYLVETLVKKNDAEFQSMFSQLEKHLAGNPIVKTSSLSDLRTQFPTLSNDSLDLLLDCYERKMNLQSKLVALAATICHYNPSIISHSPALTKVYLDQKAGPYFNIQHLHQLISNLNIDHPAPIRPRSVSPQPSMDIPHRHKVLRRMENYSNPVIHTTALDEIDDARRPLREAHRELLAFTDSQLDTKPNPKVWQFLINKIKELFAIYWSLIIDTPDDYFRSKNKKNHPWIQLAQYLAGAGHIDSNYYSLLIPSLTQQIEPITLECLTSYPLSDFILSNSNNELIYLPATRTLAEMNGQMSNYNSQYAHPFLPKEKARLKAVDLEIYDHFFTQRQFINHEPSISMATIEALRNLVNGSVNKEGLTEEILSPDQYAITEESYSQFIAYLATISPEEEKRLYAQRINYNGDTILFSELMDATQASSEEKRRCATQNGVYIAKLVIDYNHETRFSNAIETNNILEERLRYMRSCSARKVFYDYNNLDTTTANKRAMMLLVNLLTTSFHYQNFSGNTITLFGYTNTVPSTAKKIFEQLKAAELYSHLRHIRYDYVHMIEHILRPAVTKPHSRRYENTQRWYEQVLSGEIFSPESKSSFEPELIIKTLWDIASNNSKLQNTIEVFLDRFMQIYLLADDPNSKWIKLNIELNKFLIKECTPEQKNEILTAFRNNESVKINSEMMVQICKAFFINRLAMAGCSDLPVTPWLKLFSQNPDQRNSFNFKLIKTDLQTIIKPLPAIPDDLESTMHQILKTLSCFLEADHKYRNKMPMRDYLKPFTQDVEEINQPTCSSSL